MKSPLDDLPEIDRFYHVFGKAFARWGEVEYYLSLLFAHESGLGYLSAQQIFFSTHSSRSRRDMLKAALVHSILSADWCDFVARIIRKLRAYEGFRNRLAHCLMHPNALDEDGMPIEWRLPSLLLTTSEGRVGNEMSIIYFGGASVMILAVLAAFGAAQDIASQMRAWRATKR